MSIEEDLRKFISAQIVPRGEPRPLGLDQPLISSGDVDSIGLLQILGFIDQKFGVDLMSSGTPRDFETIMGMAAAIRRVRGEH
jgi:acyl carrier protein